VSYVESEESYLLLMKGFAWNVEKGDKNIRIIRIR